MDSILQRYRNQMVLVIVVGLQLILVGYQVRNKEDMRLVRVWAVSAVTPLARVLEGVRGLGARILNDYFLLLAARDENARLKEELNRLKLENQQMREDLGTADRGKALLAFQARTPSKMLAARVIANSAGVNSKVVFVDRGTVNGVMRGMAVITPDGIVGRVLLAYPMASQVMLVSDSGFAAGVVSQKAHALGIVRGQGNSNLLVDRVPIEAKVEVGERFYTSGDDRIFPRGLLAGEVKSIAQGRLYQEIVLVPSGFRSGLEEVLIVLEGVHQDLPNIDPSRQPIKLVPPVEGAPEEKDPDSSDLQTTDADRLRERYRKLAESQGLTFGTPGRTPNFNANPDAPRPRPSVTPTPAPTPAATQTPASAAVPPPPNQ